MNFAEFKYLVLTDLYRVTGDTSRGILFLNVLKNGSFKYIFWFRICSYAQTNKFLRCFFYHIAKLYLDHLSFKFGISIPVGTKIGSGLYIGHFGTIFINGKSIIGKNCNLSQGVTLGKAPRGVNKGSPSLGDNVYIGPGAKIIGAVVIGNNVAIGANCVVTKNIPDNSVVVGVPGRVISQAGSVGYISRTDYDNKN